MTPSFGTAIEGPDKGSPVVESRPSTDQKSIPWPQFIKEATDEQICSRVNEELKTLVAEAGAPLEKYCLLSLYEPQDSVDSWDSDRIFTTLQAQNHDRKKDVFLLISSPGGRDRARIPNK